jgi:hypothetical protein
MVGAVYGTISGMLLHAQGHSLRDQASNTIVVQRTRHCSWPRRNIQDELQVLLTTVIQYTLCSCGGQLYRDKITVIVTMCRGNDRLVDSDAALVVD